MSSDWTDWLGTEIGQNADFGDEGEVANDFSLKNYEDGMNTFLSDIRGHYKSLKQSEADAAWWKKHGDSVFAGVMITIGIVVGLIAAYAIGQHIAEERINVRARKRRTESAPIQGRDMELERDTEPDPKPALEPKVPKRENPRKRL